MTASDSSLWLCSMAPPLHYMDEKRPQSLPHALEFDRCDVNDHTLSLPPISIPQRDSGKNRFLKLLAVAGLAVACTFLILTCPKTAKSAMEYHPRVILKEPHNMTILDHNSPRNPAYLIEAQHGVVATENKRCSEMGVDMLRKGGSAVDAAIAATLCIGVVNSFS